ncbi:MAG: hypothetical protein LBN27_10660 [Prevotellaceae bacterium]|jgi:hypothetical protein|nr:hypothetical protein [Prevotellaceae bacterium]
MNDFLTDEDGDLLIQNGDLVIGDCRYDLARRILLAYPGEFKELPTLGCNVRSQINGTPNPFWRGEATKQLRSQGLDITKLNITANGVEVELN